MDKLSMSGLQGIAFNDVTKAEADRAKTWFSQK
jgi:hypothetical protein